MSEAPVRLSIRQFAARTGLSADTLRYYEKIGLLRQVARDASGFRVYGPRDLEWIGFILRLKDTGMALDDIIRYADKAIPHWRRARRCSKNMRRGCRNASSATVNISMRCRQRSRCIGNKLPLDLELTPTRRLPLGSVPVSSQATLLRQMAP